MSASLSDATSAESREGLDSLTDGVIGRPDKCTIDPAVMQCAAGTNGADCLSAGQVGALRKIYAGPYVG